MTQLFKRSAKITCIMRLTFQLLSNCRHAQTHTLYTTVSFCKLCNILFFYSLTGAELIMELAPVLKQFVSKHFPLPSTQEKNGEMLREDSSMKTYFEKMPSPCYVSQRRGQIDRQGVAAIVSQQIVKILFFSNLFL